MKFKTRFEATTTSRPKTWKDSVWIRTVQIGSIEVGGPTGRPMLWQDHHRGSVELNGPVDIKRCVRRTIRDQGARRLQEHGTGVAFLVTAKTDHGARRPTQPVFNA